MVMQQYRIGFVACFSKVRQILLCTVDIRNSAVQPFVVGRKDLPITLFGLGVAVTLLQFPVVFIKHIFRIPPGRYSTLQRWKLEGGSSKSISRVLYPSFNRRTVTIYLSPDVTIRFKRPTRDWPGVHIPLFGLAPDGVFPAGCHQPPVSSCSPFHLTPACAGAVCFCGTIRGFPSWALPRVLPGGVRTFLPDVNRGGHPVYLTHLQPILQIHFCQFWAHGNELVTEIKLNSL